MKRFVKSVMTVVMSFVMAISCLSFVFNNENVSIEANAWHIDFWNYESNCYVMWHYERYNSYYVCVTSSDSHTIWTNNVDYIMYWYSKNQMTEMLGFEPTEDGRYIYSVTTDVKKSLLNDETFFARFSC